MIAGEPSGAAIMRGDTSRSSPDNRLPSDQGFIGHGHNPPLEPIDYEQIQQLLARYCHCLDFQDLDGFADCCTADGTFEALSGKDALTGAQRGSAALRTFAKTVGDITGGQSRHSVTNLLIEGTGLLARVTSYLLVTFDMGMPMGARAYHKEPPLVGISTGGLNIDEVVKQGRVWKFSRRTFRYGGHPDIDARIVKPIDLRLF